MKTKLARIGLFTALALGAVAVAIIALFHFGVLPYVIYEYKTTYSTDTLPNRLAGLDFTNMPAVFKALNDPSDPQQLALSTDIKNGPADLVRARAAARKAGIALGPPPAMPPPDEIALPLYVKWEALWHRDHDPTIPLYGEVLNMRYAYTPAQLARIQNIMTGDRTRLALLHKATDLPYCAPPQGSFDGLAADREGAREILNVTYLLAHQGRYDEAIANQMRGFDMAKQAAATPSGSSFLLSNALNGMALSGMQDILCFAGPNAAVDRRAEQAVEKAPPVFSAQDVLRAGVVDYVSECNRMRSASPTAIAAFFSGSALDASAERNEPKSFTPQDRAQINRLLDAAEARIIVMMTALIAESSGPHPLSKASAVASAGAAADGAPTLDNQTDPLNQFVEGAFDPTQFESIGKSIDDTNLTIARRAVTLAAATILAQKAATGSYPARLPSEFIDPFIDKPLGYRREGGSGFVVYSVGADGKFDGGGPGRLPATYKQVGFRYPPPPGIPLPADMEK